MIKLSYIRTKSRWCLGYLYFWQNNNFTSIGYSNAIRNNFYYIKHADKEFLEKQFDNIEDDFLYKVITFENMKSLL